MRKKYSSDLEKPVENEETKTIFIRSQMHAVFKDGLAFEDHLEMIDKMLCTLFTSTASGSGWIINEVNELEIRFVGFHSIRGSSYIAVPNDLQSFNCLLNIRNHNDHIFYTNLSRHLMYGPSLPPPGRSRYVSIENKPEHVLPLKPDGSSFR